MSLNEKLQQMKQASAEKIPAEAKAVMQRAQEEIRDTGVMDGVIRAGTPAPAFSLPDAQGNTVTLEGLLKQGWLILSFYRGVW